MSSKKRHNQKKRRQTKRFLKYGPEAVPTHKLISGRTGTAHGKKTPSTEKPTPPPLVAATEDHQ